MIYDELENIGRYLGLSPWLDKAILFLEQTDLRTLPLGRTSICGENVYANVMEAEALESDLGKFEIHRRYMDIQIDLEGTEIIQIGLDPLGVLDPYLEDIDFGTVFCKNAVSCQLGPGRFILVRTMEPHKPGVATGESRHLKKCVIKIVEE